MGRLVLGIDGDDTLWHNEGLFSVAKESFCSLLAGYCSVEAASARLLEAERQNLQCFGYGAKAFALSMIETAIDLTDGQISGQEIRSIVRAARAILETPATPLDGVDDVLADAGTALPESRLLITKGDLFEQATKVARSGLARRFTAVEILSEKNPEDYQRLLTRYGWAAETFIMVGNSIRSDVLPVLEIGGTAVYIPYPQTWEIEVGDEPTTHPRFVKLDNIRQLPGYLSSRSTAM
jgi:putative hydrolase of the HAD superfamily